MWLALQVLGPDPGTVHLLPAVVAGLIGFFLGGAAAMELFNLDVSPGRSGTVVPSSRERPRRSAEAA